MTSTDLAFVSADGSPLDIATAGGKADTHLAALADGRVTVEIDGESSVDVSVCSIEAFVAARNGLGENVTVEMDVLAAFAAETGEQFLADRI